jgi:hypothetical protein
MNDSKPRPSIRCSRLRMLEDDLAEQRRQFGRAIRQGLTPDLPEMSHRNPATRSTHIALGPRWSATHTNAYTLYGDPENDSCKC